MKKFKERFMQVLFLLSALVSILAVALICIFLFANGIPAIREIGLWDFLSGTSWKPEQNIYGILPMIIGSIYVTAGAMLIGVPIGILTALFLVHFCPPKLYRFLKPAVDLLAGIPSIVYGFFGLMVIVPAIRNGLGGSGSSMLAASIVLGIMILPTIINVSESAIRAVPESYYEGSLALGATKERSIFFVMLPAAKSGIVTAIVLGVGRAIGEAMAITLVSGSSVNVPLPFNSVRFLTTAIVSEMGYSSGLHRQVLFTIGLVLFVFIMIINIVLNKILKKGADDNE